MDFKKPKLPALSSKTPSDIRRAINAIAEYLGGVADKSSRLNQSIRNLDETVKNIGDYPSQPAPTGLVVNGGFNTIFLQWDQSKTSGFAYTEIWRATEDNLSLAAQVGSTSSPLFGDTPPDASLSVTYYYWIRYVNEAGQPGPYNSESGTPGKTADEPGYVLEVLTDEITEGQLYKGLNERIDKIEVNETKIEVNETAISEETTSRQSEDEALAQRIQTVSAVADGNTSAIQTEQTARINGDDALASSISTLQVEVDGVFSSLQTKAEVSDLEAVYEVKTDINGRVTGFGMVADEESTEFGINADRFWVADPDDDANVKIPFVIDSGRVVMDTALIENLTATNFVGETINADTVNAGAEISSPVINGGEINGTTITLDGGGGDGFIFKPEGLWGFKNGQTMFLLNPGEDYLEIGRGCAAGGLTYHNGNLCLPNASVGTLEIAGNAVTVPRVYWGSDLSGAAGTSGVVVSGAINCEGGGLIVMAAANMYAPEDGWGEARLYVNGSLSHTVKMGVRTDDGADTTFRTPSIVLHALPGPVNNVTITMELEVTGYWVEFTETKLVLLGSKR